MTEAVECFSANCNDEEFEIYREEINSRLFMYHYYVTTVGELKTLYDQYCGKYIKFWNIIFTLQGPLIC